MKTIFIILIFFFLAAIGKAQWYQTNGPRGGEAFSVATNGSIVIAGAYYGVFISTNNGQNWLQTSLNNKIINAVASKDNYIFAGTVQYGIFLSSNNGQTWQQTNLNNHSIYSLC